MEMLCKTREPRFRRVPAGLRGSGDNEAMGWVPTVEFFDQRSDGNNLAKRHGMEPDKRSPIRDDPGAGESEPL
jgi:hypothetical protein